MPDILENPKSLGDVIYKVYSLHKEGQENIEVHTTMARDAFLKEAEFEPENWENPEVSYQTEDGTLVDEAAEKLFSEVYKDSMDWGAEFSYVRAWAASQGIKLEDWLEEHGKDEGWDMSMIDDIDGMIEDGTRFSFFEEYMPLLNKLGLNIQNFPWYQEFEV